MTAFHTRYQTQTMLAIRRAEGLEPPEELVDDAATAGDVDQAAVDLAIKLREAEQNQEDEQTLEGIFGPPRWDPLFAPTDRKVPS